MGVGVIAIVAMLIIPLPGFILDLLIVVSLATSLIILLTSLSTKEPSEFSIFPNLLLITTLFRLALNVSTTRQILSQGASFNSHIIDAFGTFVVGGGTGLGKYVVGFIIFLILTIVQILVITKVRLVFRKLQQDLLSMRYPASKWRLILNYLVGTSMKRKQKKKKEDSERSRFLRSYGWCE